MDLQEKSPEPEIIDPGYAVTIIQLPRVFRMFQEVEIPVICLLHSDMAVGDPLKLM
jgi:hypothetical protein